VDGSAAELLACELNTFYGVKRLYYATAEKPHGDPGSSGMDIIPNIDQFTSAYDAAHFEAYVKPKQSGLFRLTVEVVGRFLLSFRGRVSLTGRSFGAEPRNFTTGWAENLSSSEFYYLSLQYACDPNLKDGIGGETVPRRVRLFWDIAGLPAVVVPPTVFYHGFTSLNGFPRKIGTINDPYACSSAGPRVVLGERIVNGTVGVFTDGSPEFDYNPRMHCKWRVHAIGLVRIDLYVHEFFDIEKSPGCVNDRIEIFGGSEDQNTLIGAFCDAKEKNASIVSILNNRDPIEPKAEVLIDFITDRIMERPGFSIRWEIRLATDPLPDGITKVN